MTSEFKVHTHLIVKCVALGKGSVTPCNFALCMKPMAGTWQQNKAWPDKKTIQSKQTPSKPAKRKCPGAEHACSRHAVPSACFSSPFSDRPVHLQLSKTLSWRQINRKNNFSSVCVAFCCFGWPLLREFLGLCNLTFKILRKANEIIGLEWNSGQAHLQVELFRAGLQITVRI